jgi:uncharacterized surface protein with fasciclin (FAS1) repeats
MTRWTRTTWIAAVLALAAGCSDEVVGPDTRSAGDLSGDAQPAAVVTADKDIVDTAISAGFSNLVTAVQLAGLEAVLRGDGPFTVFAPTNAAFEDVPANIVAALQGNPAAIANVLTYHVVAGIVRAEDLSDGLEATTVQGEKIVFSINGGAKVNGANIIAADVEASNGIIHVIDAVLLP